MRSIREVSVGAQVVTAFAILSFILVALGALFFFSLRIVDDSTYRLAQLDVPKLRLVNDIVGDAAGAHIAVLRHMMVPTLEEKARWEQTINQVLARTLRQLAEYEALIADDQERELYRTVLDGHHRYIEQRTRLLALSDEGRTAEATVVNTTQLRPAYDRYHEAIRELADHIGHQAYTAQAEVVHTTSLVHTIGNVLVVSGLAIGVLMAVLITGVTRQLRRDNELLQREVADRHGPRRIFRRRPRSWTWRATRSLFMIRTA